MPLKFIWRETAGGENFGNREKYMASLAKPICIRVRSTNNL
jgi:hypothetical protein